jgi:predicted AAA+ superfamily ATPase
MTAKIADGVLLGGYKHDILCAFGGIMVLRKTYLQKVRPFIGTDVIKVITGIRRSGKSVFLTQILDEILKMSPETHIVYLNFEDKQNARLLKGDALYRFLLAETKAAGEKRVCFFLDEVHDAEGWETTVNSIRMKPNVDVYVTGSNSKMLSGELASQITGRYVEIAMSPFSFAEYKEAVAELFGDLDVERLFLKYLETGGMPFLPQVRFDETASFQYLDDLFWAIVSKDIVRRKEIRDVDLLERIVRYAMTEIGHEFSALSIVRFLKNERRRTTAETVLNYLKACEEAFLISRVERQDLIGKRILSVDEKYYVADLGLRRAVVGNRNGEDIDQMLENVVYRELVRRGYNVKIGRVRGKEVDFVCERTGDKLYVQVSYMMSAKETRDREFGALEAIPDQFDKIVLSMDKVDFSRNGIRHMYIPDFMLKPDA